MHKHWVRSDRIAAARRGQIIQRVLVDGWSPDRAAAAFGVTERQVVGWVAAYRRWGMASLRSATARRPRPWSCPPQLSSMLGRLLNKVLRRIPRGEPAPCVELRRSGDDRHRL